MTGFRILGPLEGPAPLPPGKPRALLARLLLDARRVVSVDTLVASLWEEPVPPSAPKVLQAHVSALRKALGRETIETRAPGYLVHAEPEDLVEFESLADRARDEPDVARRAALLGRALALWRGEALAEFRREPFARAAAARLAELRLEALALRIDADLELGEHARIVGELAALVEEEPLRERPRRQLMLALYRSGRQADALAAYRDGRRLFVERLGIEPGRALQELERAILRQDPSLASYGDARVRGPVVCSGDAPFALLAPLGRELIAVEIGPELPRPPLAPAGPEIRRASFTSDDPAAELVRLATEQAAELIVTTEVGENVLATAPCDVALANAVGALGRGPVLVPFGGAREEWAALELGAWLAQAHDRPLRLLGVEARDGRRDASRMLAAASLALQRFAGVTPETTLAAAGADGILSGGGGAIVASLPAVPPDGTRRAVMERATVPVLLVHGGIRPGGLAPDRTLTRFSWSLSR